MTSGVWSGTGDILIVNFNTILHVFEGGEGASLPESGPLVPVSPPEAWYRGDVCRDIERGCFYFSGVYLRAKSMVEYGVRKLNIPSM